MAAGKHDIRIEQGATYRKTIRLQDSTGSDVDLTGCTARMQVRSSTDATTTLLDVSASNGLTVTDPTHGKLELVIPAATTRVIRWLRGLYDLEVTHPNGDVVRWLEGQVTVTREVTR